MATDPPVPPDTVHATCLLVGEAGILIRGESGAGKSTLALALLDRALQDGSHAALVGDDRIGLERHHGRIVARGHPALRGLIEIRGLGLVRASSWAEAGIVRLVVDLAASLPRLPDVAPGSVDLLGVSLPRLMLDRTICAGGLAPRLVLDGLYGGGSVASRTHLTAVSCDPAGGM